MSGGNAAALTYGATNARGYATVYGYGPGGHSLASVTHPAGSALGAEGFAYDPLGRRRVATDGKGQTATYGYDGLDRVAGVAYAPGASQ